MKEYFDPEISDAAIKNRYPRLMRETRRFSPSATRKKLMDRGYRPEYIVRYGYRPMDVRWLYWEQETKLLDEKRSDY